MVGTGRAIDGGDMQYREGSRWRGTGSTEEAAISTGSRLHDQSASSCRGPCIVLGFELHFQAQGAALSFALVHMGLEWDWGPHS